MIPARRYLLLAALAAVAATSARAEEPATSPALKAVQGVWTTRDDVEVQATWTIKGDSIKVEVNGTEYAGKVTVDDAAKPHPTLTIDVKEGPGDAEGKAAKGVYKLDGDKLVVNIGTPGVDRPADFKPDGIDVYLFELTKKKDAR